MEIELGTLIVIGVLLLFAVPLLVGLARKGVERAKQELPPPRRPGGYEWDRRTDQLYRKVKRVPGPSEDRDRIVEFLDSHEGVEAYVEPKTVMHPLSVVLVDVDGAWRRFELSEDAVLRELARTRHLKIVDAARFGYPSRMRRQGGAGPTDR
jgi:hypothetical protein